MATQEQKADIKKDKQKPSGSGDGWLGFNKDTLFSKNKSAFGKDEPKKTLAELKGETSGKGGQTSSHRYPIPLSSLYQTSQTVAPPSAMAAPTVAAPPADPTVAVPPSSMAATTVAPPGAHVAKPLVPPIADPTIVPVATSTAANSTVTITATTSAATTTAGSSAVTVATTTISPTTDSVTPAVQITMVPATPPQSNSPCQFDDYDPNAPTQDSETNTADEHIEPNTATDNNANTDTYECLQYSAPNDTDVPPSPLLLDDLSHLEGDKMEIVLDDDTSSGKWEKFDDDVDASQITRGTLISTPSFEARLSMATNMPKQDPFAPVGGLKSTMKDTKQDPKGSTTEAKGLFCDLSIPESLETQSDNKMPLKKKKKRPPYDDLSDIINAPRPKPYDGSNFIPYEDRVDEDSEEWQAFQAMQNRIKETVKTTKDSLGKLNEESLVQENGKLKDPPKKVAVRESVNLGAVAAHLNEIKETPKLTSEVAIVVNLSKVKKAETSVIAGKKSDTGTGAKPKRPPPPRPSPPKSDSQLQQDQDYDPNEHLDFTMATPITNGQAVNPSDDLLGLSDWNGTGDDVVGTNSLVPEQNILGLSIDEPEEAEYSTDQYPYVNVESELDDFTSETPRQLIVASSEDLMAMGSTMDISQTSPVMGTSQNEGTTAPVDIIDMNGMEDMSEETDMTSQNAMISNGSIQPTGSLVIEGCTVTASTDDHLSTVLHSNQTKQSSMVVTDDLSGLEALCNFSPSTTKLTASNSMSKFDPLSETPVEEPVITVPDSNITGDMLDSLLGGDSGVKSPTKTLNEISDQFDPLAEPTDNFIKDSKSEIRKLPIGESGPWGDSNAIVSPSNAFEGDDFGVNKKVSDKEHQPDTSEPVSSTCKDNPFRSGSSSMDVDTLLDDEICLATKGFDPFATIEPDADANEAMEFDIFCTIVDDEDDDLVKRSSKSPQPITVAQPTKSPQPITVAQPTKSPQPITVARPTKSPQPLLIDHIQLSKSPQPTNGMVKLESMDFGKLMDEDAPVVDAAPIQDASDPFNVNEAVSDDLDLLSAKPTTNKSKGGSFDPFGTGLPAPKAPTPPTITSTQEMGFTKYGFTVGERVWVSGVKAGYIAFLGETLFAPGDWAGILLDYPIGKNDGSIQGTRYFTCVPKKGLFTHPERLSRTESYNEPDTTTELDPAKDQANEKAIQSKPVSTSKTDKTQIKKEERTKPPESAKIERPKASAGPKTPIKMNTSKQSTKTEKAEKKVTKSKETVVDKKKVIEVVKKKEEAVVDLLDLSTTAVETPTPRPTPKKDTLDIFSENVDSPEDGSEKIKVNIRKENLIPFADDEDVAEAAIAPALPPPPTKKETLSPARFNPFDKQEGPDEQTMKNITKYEEIQNKIAEEDKDGKKPPMLRRFSTDSSSDASEEEAPVNLLEDYHSKYEEDGWKLKLRHPAKKSLKKKVSGGRSWKDIHARLEKKDDGYVIIKLFNNETDKKPFQELPIQAVYKLTDCYLQQYDQFGKIHSLKLNYVNFKERPGIRTDKIMTELSYPHFLERFRPKPTMILDHTPQNQELMKFGSLDADVINSFKWELEDALMKLESVRLEDAALKYTKDEIRLEVQDEFEAVIDKEGHITSSKARARVFSTTFLSGMSSVELGINDKRRKGKEVVSRHDIIPIKTDEWIRIQQYEFHNTVDQEEFENSGIVKYSPLDATYYELMRFRVCPRVNQELPLQLRIIMNVTTKSVDIRAEVMIPGYHSNSRRAGQVPCEDIQIVIPVPEAWIYLFRVEKRFRYGSVHSQKRNPGKIKGIERITALAQGFLPKSLMEASSGQAKYEHLFRGIVWRLEKLPKINDGAYKTHLFQCRFDLGPHDPLPDTFNKYASVQYTMPNTTVSGTQIRSVTVNNPQNPEKWVKYRGCYSHKVEIELTVDKSPKSSLLPQVDVATASSQPSVDGATVVSSATDSGAESPTEESDSGEDGPADEDNVEADSVDVEQDVTTEAETEEQGQECTLVDLGHDEPQPATSEDEKTTRIVKY